MRFGREYDQHRTRTHLRHGSHDVTKLVSDGM